MKPLRILHVIESLGRGGAERQLVNQILAHDRSSIQSSVIVLNPPLHLAHELKTAGVAITTFDLPRFRDFTRAIFRLTAMVKALKPDIIHTWLTRADIYGRIAAMLGGRIPVISGIHAPIYAPTMYLDNPQQKRWKLALIRQLDRWSGYLAKTIYVGCSYDAADSTSKALSIPPERLRVIYNSINISNATSNHSGKKIITVGRMIPQKGQIYLINAMPAILAQHPDATLDIVGEGPLRSELEQQVLSLGIGHAVRFLGVRSDVPDLLASSDVFAFPSLWEGLGIVMLEALAAGLPVVASNIAVLREIVDDGQQGLLVQTQHPQALAQAIINLLADPDERRSMGQSGRRKILERFDINVTVSQWTELYQELALKD
jgi:glycosyltransferase involved in cell wall biosynthesis